MRTSSVEPIILGIAAMIFLVLAVPQVSGAPACPSSALQCVNASTPKDGLVRIAQVPTTKRSSTKAVIDEPEDDTAKKAFKVLDKHCARCHQAGRLTRDRPARNFGNILKLDELARDPSLIRPGNPDGSRLFSRIVKQEMPYDVYTEFSGGEEPDKEDVQALYDWIESLNTETIASCGNRKLMDSEKIVTEILADVNKQSAGRRKSMRYLTLSNYYNLCADKDELARLRNGVVKMLNSLSRAAKTTRTRTIDSEKTIVAFNLDDLAWSDEDWDTLASNYPYGVRPKTRTFDQLAGLVKTQLPWMRGDWFAAAASRPPLYYKMLDLPEELDELQNQLLIDAAANRDDGAVDRAGFEGSGESRNNRIVERHALGDGYFWMTFDFKGTDPEQNIFERPIGPGGDSGFVHDLNTAIFSLPNGMNAFYLSDGDGKRLDTGPVDIIHDDARPGRPIITALTCLACHGKGVVRATDQVRDRTLSGGSLAPEDRNRVEDLYTVTSDMDRIFQADRESFSSTASRAGVNLELGSDGIEDINHLVQRYEKHLDLRIAAAEYGVTSEAYAAGMVKAGEEAVRTKQELEQSLLPRRLFEPRFYKTISAVSNDAPVAQVKEPASRPSKPPLASSRVKTTAKGKKTSPKKTKKVVATTTKKPKKQVKKTSTKKVASVANSTPEPEPSDNALTVFSDKSKYEQNDFAVFTVRSSVDCQLTLINVDPSGNGTVIFPNKFQQDNFLKADTDFQFPGPDAPFQFRLKDAGTEKVVAECTGKDNDTRIEHNFANQEFTDLGDYRDYVGEQAENEGKKKTENGKEEQSLLSRTAITLKVK